jgi:hypothetical protein
LLGLAFLTKVTLYPLAAVVLAGGLLGELRSGRSRPEPSPTIQYGPNYRYAGTARGAGFPFRRAWGVVGPLVVGAVIAAPWFVRNVVEYGPGDPFGLRRHDAVVVGQERTADWLALHGAADTLQRLAVFTFESFWGVFGWMGVFLAPWAYGLMALFTAAASASVVAAARRTRGHDGRGPDAYVVIPLALTIVTVVAGFLLYNLTFVQHQGRYLFPALAPIAILVAYGTFEMGATTARSVGQPAWSRCGGAAAVLTGATALATLAYLALDRYVALPTP